jgi:hypothetical protein
MAPWGRKETDTMSGGLGLFVLVAAIAAVMRYYRSRN